MHIVKFQLFIMLIIAVAIFATQVFCFIDAARRPSHAFTSAGKRTKGFWLMVLAVAGVFGFLALPYPIGIGFSPFIGIISVVPAIVFIVDVRPAIRGYGRGGGSGRRPRDNRGGW